MIPKLRQVLTRGDYRVLLLCAIIVLGALANLLQRLYISETTPLPADGGSYVEGAVGRVTTLNPVYCTASSVDQDLCSLIFSGLTRFDPESNAVWGDIAYRWNVDADGKTYTFYLRRNAFWHDGTPLTADDVIYTYHDVLQSPQYQGALKDAFRDTEIKKTDDYTVTFTLKKENAFFPGFLTTGLLPKHLLADTPVSDLQGAPFSRHPIGSGMYQLDEWITSQTMDQIELTAFGRYYRSQPHIRHFTFMAFNTMKLLLEKKSALSGIRHIPQSEVTQIAADDTFQIHSLLLNRYVAVLFNTARPFLKNASTRKGLRESIQYDLIAQSVPDIQLINSPIPHTSTGSNKYDIERAKEYLYDAGWKLFQQKYTDGMRRNDAQQLLELTLVTTSDKSLQKVAEILKSSWAAVGVQVKIITLGIGEVEKKHLETRDYDMLLLGQSLGSDIDLYTFWHSTQTAHPGLNLTEYKSPEADLLIEKIRKTHDYREQLELTKSLIQLIQNDVPAVFLYTPYHLYATRTDIGNIFIAQNIGHVYDRFALLPEWYIRVKRIWSHE